jgi:tetratricopeptide (TPR) repeat protein
LCLLVVVVRVTVPSRALWLAGEAAQKKGDLDQAIREFGRAARMYAPGNPYSERALLHLVRLGEESAGRGDRDGARRCLREAKSALLATRSFYTPHAGLLDEIDRRLFAAEDAAAPGGRPGPPFVAPAVVPSLALLLGAVLFIAAAMAIVLVAARARLFLVLGTFGLLLFLLGLWLA